MSTYLDDHRWSHMTTYRYNQSDFPWRQAFSQLYGIDNLENLHSYLPCHSSFYPINDSSHLLHKIYYSNFSSIFSDLYLQFLRELALMLDTSFYYQKIPCVRFGLPRMSWISKYHVDSDYNHPLGELNINLAITQSYGSCALLIEDSPSSNKYIPLEQSYGSFTFINHLFCKHGTQTNTEDHTLISLDFRLLLPDYCSHPPSKTSILRNLKFTPGHYFSSNLVTS